MHSQAALDAWREGAVTARSRPVAPVPAAARPPSAEMVAVAKTTEPGVRRFDEVTLFDLEDESRPAGDGAGSETGRRRRRYMLNGSRSCLRGTLTDQIKQGRCQHVLQSV